MVDESEKKRRERNCRAQQRHRDKTRERAAQRDSRIRELEQAMEEIGDAVENNCLDRVRLVLARITKSPSDCILHAGGLVGYFSAPQPYIGPALNFALCDTVEQNWMGFPSMLEALLPTFAPESQSLAWSGSQQIVSTHGQQAYLL